MTDKVFKRQRIQMMSAVKPPQPPEISFDNQFFTSQKKKKKKAPSPEPHYMNPHHRNCPACLEKYKQAS